MYNCSYFCETIFKKEKKLENYKNLLCYCIKKYLKNITKYKYLIALSSFYVILYFQQEQKIKKNQANI